MGQETKKQYLWGSSNFHHSHESPLGNDIAGGTMKYKFCCTPFKSVPAHSKDKQACKSLSTFNKY